MLSDGDRPISYVSLHQYNSSMPTDWSGYYTTIAYNSGIIKTQYAQFDNHSDEASDVDISGMFVRV